MPGANDSIFIRNGHASVLRLNCTENGEHDPDGKYHRVLANEHYFVLCNNVNYGHVHYHTRKSELPIDSVAMSLSCPFNSDGHLPDAIAIAIHESGDNGTIAIANVCNDGDELVLRVSGSYLRSVNGK